jgi:Raf kinase inhibitor-like YbhB/YbcL family protein
MLGVIMAKKIVNIVKIALMCLGGLGMSINNTYSTIDLEGELMLKSKAFKHEDIIPKEYTCEGQDWSPPLNWNKISDALSYVLIVDDPDAPKEFLKKGEDAFVHWVVYNIVPQITGFPENISEASLVGYAQEGTNSFGKKGYGGPCPPKGSRHRYRFKLYALKKKLDLPAGATKEEVVKAMNDSIIEQSELNGTFGR